MSTMYKAVGDKVVVKKKDVSNESHGIIMINNPDTDIFTIVSKGSTVDKYMPGLDIGDNIIINRRANLHVDTVLEDGKSVEYFAVHCGDILSIVEDD